MLNKMYLNSYLCLMFRCDFNRHFWDTVHIGIVLVAA